MENGLEMTGSGTFGQCLERNPHTPPDLHRGRPADAETKKVWMSALGSSIRTSAGLQALDIAPRAALVDDWFMEGDLGFIYAPRGLGKTWLALGLAAAVAGGKGCGPWSSHAPRRVLFIDGEMPCKTLAERIAALGGSFDNLEILNHEALFHLCNGSLNLALPEVQSALTQLLLERGVKVLFLDNLSSLFPGLSENDADSWEAVQPWLMKLRRHRIAVVIVHHAGRNKTVMRGTSRREDSAFWVVRLEEAESDTVRNGARFISRFTKNRNSPADHAPIQWDFSANAKSGGVEIGWSATTGLEEFRRWIEAGLTGAEDIAEEMGVTKGTISKMAHKAMAAGWLKKLGRNYALVEPVWITGE